MGEPAEGFAKGPIAVLVEGQEGRADRLVWKRKDQKPKDTAIHLNNSASLVGAEIWEGDERRKFQCLESGDSLNGRNLFNELPFL